MNKQVAVLFSGMLTALSVSAFNFGDLTSHSGAIGCSDYDYDTKTCRDEKPPESENTESITDSLSSFNINDIGNPLEGMSNPLEGMTNPLEGINFNSFTSDSETSNDQQNTDYNLSINTERFVSDKVDALCKEPVAEWDSTKGMVELAMIGGTFFVENLLVGDTSTEDRQLALKQKAIHLNWMPMVVEKGIGKYIHETTYKDQVLSENNARNRKAKGNLEKANRIWNEVVQIIDKEYPEHPYEWNFYVLNNTTRAFASSGGYIYLGNGLLIENEDVIKMVLIHEASHVLKRHKTKRFQAVIIDIASSIDMIQDLAKSGANQGAINKAMEAIGLANHVNELIGGFDDKQEFEADACAVMTASKAKISRSVAQNQFGQVIRELMGDHSDTHGSVDNRIQNLETVVNHYY